MIYDNKTDITPEQAGYNPKVLAVLDAHFQRLIDSQKIEAASYLMARDGKVFVHRSLGRTSIPSGESDLLPDSIRPIASVTKVITAMGILKLVEQGVINLYQSVASIIREFDNRMYEGITIFHLLTHTSGLRGDPGSFLEPFPDYGSREEWTVENYMSRMLTGVLQYKPGTVWNYCSLGFQILAEIIARVSGMDYTDFITRNLFEPLGMSRSFFFVPEQEKKNVFVNHEWHREWLKKKKTDMPSTCLMGAGGVFSCLVDLWKFAQMMLDKGTFDGKHVFGRKTIEAATREQVRDLPGYNWSNNMFDVNFRTSYGLGWNLNKNPLFSRGTFDHEGACGAAIFVDPVERLIFVGFYPGPPYLPESCINTLSIAWSGLK